MKKCLPGTFAAAVVPAPAPAVAGAGQACAASAVTWKDKGNVK